MNGLLPVSIDWLITCRQPQLHVLVVRSQVLFACVLSRVRGRAHSHTASFRELRAQDDQTKRRVCANSFHVNNSDTVVFVEQDLIWGHLN